MTQFIRKHRRSDRDVTVTLGLSCSCLATFVTPLASQFLLCNQFQFALHVQEPRVILRVRFLWSNLRSVLSDFSLLFRTFPNLSESSRKPVSIWDDGRVGGCFFFPVLCEIALHVDLLRMAETVVVCAVSMHCYNTTLGIICTLAHRSSGFWNTVILYGRALTKHGGGVSIRSVDTS
jgi:hypothetical protein